MRNSENAIYLHNVKEDNLHGSGILNSAESMFFKCYKSCEENVQSTCLIRDAENNKVQRERKRVEQFHNMDGDDATLNKCKKYDGLEDFIISQQSIVKCELESTLVKNNKTSCQESEENTNTNHPVNQKSSFNNFIVDSGDISQSVNVINVLCPICNRHIQVKDQGDKDLAVNKHIDICLNNQAISNLNPKPHSNFFYQNNQNFNECDKGKNFSYKASNVTSKGKASKSNSILKYMINKG